MTGIVKKSVLETIDTLEKEYNSNLNHKVFIDQVLVRLTKSQVFLDYLVANSLKLSDDNLSFNSLRKLTDLFQKSGDFKFLLDTIEAKCNEVHGEYEVLAYKELERFLEDKYSFFYNVIMAYRAKGLLFAEISFGEKGFIEFGNSDNGGAIRIGTTGGKFNYLEYKSPERYVFTYYKNKLESIRNFIDMTPNKVASKSIRKFIKKELRVLERFIESLDIEFNI